ncbi:hypothetical protein BCR34DRAFT_606246 [Clohesyomyces aquaticus]|uniref:Uncharacterized protein n=1 Tax=Clohesyomyces aquaticus TaxID=1231657 RepID=A0A1Y1YR47_9PLEO|nr:hypothetical protein BCR34DRAFT_606246 [Clohesyomyces aquaticus]
MSSLPLSQAFLNAPDDFLHPSSQGSDPANEIQPSTALQDRLDWPLKSTGHDHQKTSSVSGPSHRTPITKASSAEAEPPETNVDTPEDREHVVDFEMHYGISQRSVREVLKEILEDVTTHKNLHDWDSKLVVTPLKKLETVIRSYLATCSQEMLNDLLIHSSVEEVLRVHGKQQSKPALQQNGQAHGQFFFSKKVDEDTTAAQVGEPVKLSRGRIICVTECESHNERAALLWVYALCIRLQDEDKAYIRKFIEHHLSLKSVMATPDHWQPISPPESGTEQHQKHYRRVSMSFHLTYLTMSSVEIPTERHGDLDRSPIFALHSSKEATHTTNYHLFKACSSVLLTLVIPEESISRKEEIQLLRSPQGLWTVLTINYPRQNSNRELEEHLTPISQFIRGITAALLTQLHNAESIFGLLGLELQSCDKDGLFDDPQFTKSKTYHRTIQGCNELKDSLDSTFRFMEKLNNGQLKELSSIVHSCEQLGVNHWTREMNDAIYSLRELRIQIEGLNKRALESRAAVGDNV